MATYGAVENISDLLYLRGVDIAITHADVFLISTKNPAAARNASTGTNDRQASSNDPLPAPARADASALEKSPLFEEFLEWRQKQQQQPQQPQQPQQKNRKN